MEQSLGSARATVLVYDDQNKRWLPAGPSQTQGMSKVHIYQSASTGACRVVGRKLQDHEVVLNCAVLKNSRYNQATATFHQLRDQKLVYGFNFVSKEEADAFANVMQHTLDMLPAMHKVQQPTISQQQSDLTVNAAQSGADQHVRESASYCSVAPVNAYSSVQTSHGCVPPQQQNLGALYAVPFDDSNVIISTNQHQSAGTTNSMQAKMNDVRYADDQLRARCAQQPTADELDSSVTSVSHSQNVSPAVNEGFKPSLQHALQAAGYALPNAVRSPLPAVASQQVRNGASPQLSAPPITVKPTISNVPNQNSGSNLQPEAVEKENSPPEQADTLAMALRSVKLRKADASHQTNPASNGIELTSDAPLNEQTANGKIMPNADSATPKLRPTATVTTPNASPLNGARAAAGSNDVFSEMQRVFAARKARVDASSTETTNGTVPLNGTATVSGAAVKASATLTNTNSSTNLSVNDASSVNTAALDGPVTMKELQNLKTDLITELRREISVLKAEILDAIRQQSCTSRR